MSVLTMAECDALIGLCVMAIRKAEHRAQKGQAAGWKPEAGHTDINRRKVEWYASIREKLFALKSQASAEATEAQLSGEAKRKRKCARCGAYPCAASCYKVPM